MPRASSSASFGRGILGGGMMDLAVGQTMIDCGTASSANHEQRAYEDLILKKQYKERRQP